MADVFRQKTPPPHARRLPTSPADPEIRRIERLSYLLDNAIRVPGTNYRIGYDAVIGLIPGVGDAVGLVLSSFIIAEAARLGVPPRTLVRMASNVGVEAVAGMVPLLGDLFDATWKANARNVQLIRHHRAPDVVPRPPGNRRYFRNVVVLALASLGIFIVLLVFLFRWLGQYL